MIVTAKRQEIDASLLKKKKQLSSVSLSETGRVRSVNPFLTVYMLSLCLFFVLLGTELPYKQFLPPRGLSNLTMPGEFALQQVEIKTLRAETPVLIPQPQDSDFQVRLWDVPHQRYRMKEGERLSSVSQRYGRSISTLISFNRLESISGVHKDDILLIPSVDGIVYKTTRNDNLENLIFRYGLEKRDLVLYNPHIQIRDKKLEIFPGQELFLPDVSLTDDQLRDRTGQLYVFPVQGRILTTYGSIRDNVTQIESFHNGIDIKGDLGDPVVAALDGTIISAGFNNSYGNFIVVDHRNGYKTLYAHLNSISVRRNDKVLQGEIIAEVGKSGFAPSAHLHFSLFKGKKSVDPLDFLH
ncbi:MULTISPECIES: peptidoglycan DD-metalloendopeptidase family protein [unclassified Oceanispirochaeta]|uniref:peptidoglycan DD-metalloendopeptidase family protein n=1 Tax=unclassified Oceanispirochaeta TaxID=2635722 RepID=UPI000E09B5B0|nr:MULTISPECIES: M23 family metallopeptidase [unclassified Oceanispirochaeta]MBF9014769.1 peptidoglycan DD-metalloendopeptidase family protein [Oceanispirochaeta sp. M2]NPD71025.1 peptidoglycan DD-metalloendopeptidase family protein [Oceanispirochaeta sp. M1]RDG33858.1 LysM peptidoglycan-binding domain-containing protein [Oceanispirochaeta sp. M1]